MTQVYYLVNFVVLINNQPDVAGRFNKSLNIFKMSSTVQTAAQIPSIMTANTYFWKPASSATARKANEKKRTNEVASFLKELGFEIINHDTNSVTAKSGEIEVYFNYAESCNNVYKSLAILYKGLPTNITRLRKMLN